MAKKKRSGQTYAEGDVFAVPLRDDGWALGVLARRKDATAVGYFFAPRMVAVSGQVPRLMPDDLFVVKRFADLGLLEGDWPILGRLPDWDRWVWPIPDFGRVEPVTGRAWRVRYPDDDPSGRPSEEPISAEECERLPRDGLAGAGAVEKWLTALFGAVSEDYPGGPVAHARGLDWWSIVRDAQERLATGEGRALSVASDPGGGGACEQAVVVQARLADDGFGSDEDRALLDALEAELIGAVENYRAGEFDGAETGMGFATLFLYGPDADSLFAVVEPVLRAARLRPGSHAVKRYGPPGSDEARVQLS